MFVTGEFLVDLNFPVTRARLAGAACTGSVKSASEGAYSDGLASLVRSGQAGVTLGMPELVEVRCRQLIAQDESAILALRWEARVPGGALFTALDADIMLIPEGEHATRISLSGVCRSPPTCPGAASGEAIWRQTAAPTIRFFLARISVVLADGDDLLCEEPGHRGRPGTGRQPETLSLVPLAPGVQAQGGPGISPEPGR